MFWNPHRHQYANRWIDEPTEFIYSGQGSKGDMTETGPNADLLSHEATGEDILVFYKISSNGSQWKHLGKYQILDHEWGGVAIIRPSFDAIYVFIFAYLPMRHLRFSPATFQSSDPPNRQRSRAKRKFGKRSLDLRPDPILRGSGRRALTIRNESPTRLRLYTYLCVSTILAALANCAAQSPGGRRTMGNPTTKLITLTPMSTRSIGSPPFAEPAMTDCITAATGQGSPWTSVRRSSNVS